MKTRATVAMTAGSMAVLSAVLLLIVIRTGVYNVAATSPHSKLAVWTIKALTHRSVEAHARGLKPSATAHKANDKEGFRKFENNGCVLCHGAPGVEPTAIGKGLYPHPPEIWKESDETLAEDYWIISNGIKDTGMPAFKASVKEDDLWLIASFVKRMTGMTAKDYEGMRSNGN